MAPKIVVITGPTASGKTKLSIELARIYGGEIVGADSMQIYKYMDIGTAKPTEEEKRGIPHHMFDFVSPLESYSVSRYAEDASRAVDDIISRGKLPIIVGGTGLYIDALISGTEFLPDGSGETREKYSAMYDSVGGDEMLKKLSEFDEYSAKKLHSNDKKRIVRAFEVYELTGMTISEHDAMTKTSAPKYDAVKIALSYENRDDLYARINDRVDIMMGLGLEAEVRALYDMGLSDKNTSMQAIGYKEMCEYIAGKCSLSSAVDTIKLRSRRYAKRQLSWLRRYDDVNMIFWGNPPDFDSGIRDSTLFLEKHGIIKPY